MGLSWNPEPAENILMEPKMLHTYVHAYSIPYQRLYTCTYSMRVLSLMNIFLPGKPMRFSESEWEIWQLFSAVFLSLVTHKPRFEGLPYKVSTSTQEDVNCVHQRKDICFDELTREAVKLLEAKYLRFPAKKFAQTQINYESSYSNKGLKSVDIDPFPTIPLL